MEFKIIDNSAVIMSAMERQVHAGLEAAGITCESYAKQNIAKGIPRNGGSWYTPKGDLQNSIAHQVDDGEKAVYIGTNLSYAKFNELGTGHYAGGRSGYWVFVKGGGGGSSKKGSNTGKTYSLQQAKRVMALLRSKGLEAHITDGLKPLHFLKNAAADHADQYKKIITDFLLR